jgi:hypothetical protein
MEKHNRFMAELRQVLEEAWGAEAAPASSREGGRMKLTHRQEANALIQACVRNNSPLEDYHASQVPINDLRMKELMIAASSNLAFILEVKSLCASEGEYLQALKIMTSGLLLPVPGWDEEQVTGILATFMGQIGAPKLVEMVRAAGEEE